MSILFLDTIRNGIPVALLQGHDVKGTILVNPDPNLPSTYLKSVGVLNTTTKLITFYNESSEVESTLDLSEVDLSAVEQAAADAKTAADTAQERADSAHSLASGATAEATAATAAAAANALVLTTHAGRLDEQSARITAIKLQLEGVEAEALTATNRAEAAMDIAVEARDDVAEIQQQVHLLDGRVLSNLDKITALETTAAETEQELVQISNTNSEQTTTLTSHTNSIADMEAELEAQNEALAALGERVTINDDFIDGLDVNSIMRTGSDIEVGSITSDGSYFIEDLYIPPDSETATAEVPNSYRFIIGDTLSLTFDKQVFDIRAKRLTGLQAGVDELDAVRMREFTEVKTKVEANESGLNAVVVDLNSQTTKISNLETNSATKTELSTLSTKVDTHEAALNSASSDIQDLQNSSATKTELTNAENTLNERIDNIEADGGVDLSNYVQKDTDVSFHKMKSTHMTATHGSYETDIYVGNSGNTNIDLSREAYIRTKKDGVKTSAITIDDSGRVINHVRIKVPIICNSGSWSTDTSAAATSFVQLSSGTVKVGANEHFYVDVNGKVTTSFNNDNVNFASNDYITGVNMRAKDARQPLDAVNWGELQGYSKGGVNYETYISIIGGNASTNFEADGIINPFVHFSSETGHGSVVWDGAKQNQKIFFAVHNTSRMYNISVNLSLNGTTQPRVTVPPLSMMQGEYHPDLNNGEFVYSIESTNKNQYSSHYNTINDIPLEEIVAGDVFFTQDSGIVKAVANGANIELQPMQGYDVPELENEVAELQEHKSNNAPIITYFKNQNEVTINYTHEHPNVQVQILDTAQPLEDTGLTLLDEDTGTYSGTYNSVGAMSIGYSNFWITNYVYHNAYKHVSENYYVVYDQSITKWVILDTDVAHTILNADVGNSKIDLNQNGSLPETTGSHTISLSVNDVNSLEFLDAVADTRINEELKQVIVKFGSTYPSGKIIIS